METHSFVERKFTEMETQSLKKTTEMETHAFVKKNHRWRPNLLYKKKCTEMETHSFVKKNGWPDLVLVVELTVLDGML